MNKIKFTLALSVVMFATFADAREAQELYNKSCIACHASGAAGAPKMGDKAAWAPRLAKGLDKVVANAKTGINAMPPKGMCMDCTDDEFKALIHLMSASK